MMGKRVKINAPVEVDTYQCKKCGAEVFAVKYKFTNKNIVLNAESSPAIVLEEYFGEVKGCTRGVFTLHNNTCGKEVEP